MNSQSRALRLLSLLLIVGLSITTITSCNIFSWSSHDDEESLIDEGNRLMRDAEYNAAAEKFARAMAKNPNDSEARYYHAKAVLHASGFNSLFLGTIMTDVEFAGAYPFPFTGPAWPSADAKLYTTMQVVRGDLEPILTGQATGVFDSADVDLDFALANAIEGTLLMRDSNFDGKIDNADFEFSFSFQPGAGMSVINLKDYLSPAKAGSKGFDGQTSATNVDSLIVTFNNLLDSAGVVVNRSRDIIEHVLAENVGLDPDEINQVLTQVIKFAQYYKINDPADNDGDGYVSKYGVGYDEQINAVDDDGDGFIDEDSRYPWDQK